MVAWSLLIERVFSNCAYQTHVLRQNGRDTEEIEMARGRFIAHKLTPSAFIAIGFKLEEDQYVFYLCTI